MRSCVLCLFCVVAHPACADLFKAAGRVETVGGGSCSASLIQPDVIVTAAHCVEEGDGSAYVFRLGGMTDVEPVSLVKVVVHPHYTSFRNQRFRRLRFDIAVGRLAEPIDSATATPFAVGEDAIGGEGLFVASWRGADGLRPRSRRCVVIDSAAVSLVTLGCSVRGGESGAPVLRLTDDGVELVAVINSTARHEGRSVALASNARLRLQPLLDLLEDHP